MSDIEEYVGDTYDNIFDKKVDKSLIELLDFGVDEDTAYKIIVNILNKRITSLIIV